MLEHAVNGKWDRDEGGKDRVVGELDDAQTETGHKEFSRLIRLAIERDNLRPYR
jgi:hypothetical protein